MSDAPYIVAAYGITWLVLLGYTAYLLTRARHARQAARSLQPGASDV
ncbi:MAG TPA: heme exporter protein CcmD [Gemmatimonadaceae bacterium]|nr:heme exporter protein CcmD [Gemmatimonadaceae bacterium]